MGDVQDFEDLLAALEDDPSKVTLHENPDLTSVTQTGNHDALQMYRNSSLLHDQNQFNTLQHSIGHDDHHSLSSITAGIDPISQSVDLLDNAAIQDSYQSHVKPSDQNSMQSGSSLGSLFLDSVDEILSNEKTTHADFASPTSQTVAPKPARSKPKKSAQRKAEKIIPRQQATLDQKSSQGIMSMQQMSANTKNISMTGDENQALLSGMGGSLTNSGNRMQAINTVNPVKSSEQFSKLAHRQQNAPLPRPHSNASCDNTFYSGSVPQPSPCGSVDSTLAPRTPLSNQSLHQPLTPQSNHSLSLQSNQSGSVTPLPQIQQHTGLLSDASILTMEHSPPPIIPDDQSHLQYLNTTTAPSQMSKTTIPVGEDLLEDLSNPVKTIYQDQFGNQQFLESYTTFTSVSSARLPSHLTSQNINVLSIDPGPQLSSFDLTCQSNTADSIEYMINTQQSFLSNPQTLAISSNTHTENYSFNNANNPNLGLLHQSNSQINAASNTSYGMTDGLTYNQSQILDNLSEWGKTKAKASETISKEPVSRLGTVDIAAASQAVSYNQRILGQNALSSENANLKAHMNSSQPQSNVLNLLSTAETGIKQMLSQSNVYEAVSPISDYSPIHKEPSDKKLNENVLSDSARSHSQLMPSDLLQSGLHSGSLQANEEKTKAGPLARRRSASSDRKVTQSATKPNTLSGEFNFEDEFGFDQNEPTIRLPTKRSETTDANTSLISVSSDVPKPVLPQTMQRENYSDPSLFDSLQELAALKQQKSYMEALHASRNMKPSPQKPSRHIQKSVPSTSNIHSGYSRYQSNASGFKSTKQKKSSKVQTGKDTNSKSFAMSKTSVDVNVQPTSTSITQKQISEKVGNVSTDNDLFYQQFLNDPKVKPNSAKDNSHPVYSTAQFYSATTASSMLSNSQLNIVSGSASGVSTNSNTRRAAPFKATSLSNKPTSNINSLLLSSSTSTVSHSAITSSNLQSSKDDFNSLIAQSKQLEQQLFPSPGLPPKATQIISTASTVKVQPVTSKGLPVEQIPSFNMFSSQQSIGKSTDPLTSLPFQTTQDDMLQMYLNFDNKALPRQRQLASSDRSLTNPAAQRYHAVSTASSLSNIGEKKSFENQKSKTNTAVTLSLPTTTLPLDLYSSFKTQHSEISCIVTSSSAKNFVSSTTNTKFGLEAHKPINKTFDRYSALPDMSQIQFDFTTASLTTSSFTVISTVPKLSHSVSSVSSSTIQPTQLLNKNLSSSITSAFSTVSTSILPSSAVSMPSEDAFVAKPSSHTINHLPTSTNPQILHGIQPLSFSELPPHFGWPQDTLNSFLHPNQPALSQSMDILRRTQKQFERQSADKAVSQSTTHLHSENFSSSNFAKSTPASGKSATLPTYQQSVDMQQTNLYSSMQSPLLSMTSGGSLPMSLTSKPTIHMTSQKSDDQFLPTGVNVSSGYSKKIQQSTTPVDFSSKSATVQHTAAVPAVSVSAVSSTTSSVISTSQQMKSSVKSTFSQLSSTTSVNILKDKTYHGPKKKHILEKYSQEQVKPFQYASTHTNDEKVGVSKARRVSVDKSISAQSKHKGVSGNNFAASKSLNTSSSNSNVIANKGVAGVKENVSLVNTTSVLSASTNETSKSNNANSAVLKSTGKSSQKEPESGSILSLFDLLLKEATESAAESLKKDPIKKKDNSAVKSKDSATSKSKNEAEKPKHEPKTTLPSKEQTANIDIQPPSHSPRTTSCVTKTKSTVVSGSSVPPVTKTIATFPFKRRHLQTKVSSTSTTAVTLPAAVATIANVPITSLAKVVSSSVNLTTASSSGLAFTPEPTKVSVTMTATPSFKSELSKPGGLKLRITAFRSATGNVIHQAVALGDLIHEGELSDDSVRSYKTKKRKKHKKHKKRLKRSSSSESSTSLSSVVAILPKSISLQKPTLSKGNDSPQSAQGTLPSVNSGVTSDTGSDTLSSKKKRKRKVGTNLLRKTLQRNRSSSESGDNNYEKPKRLTKTISKKPQTKTGLRYKLKSSSHSTVSSLSMSFNRAPGKPPLYLNAGVNQTLISGSSQSVPTIQLVPRANQKLGSKSQALQSVPVSPVQSAAKVLNVKLGGSNTKTVQAHIMPKTSFGGVRYLLQSSSPVVPVPASPRLIIPKLSSPSFSVGKATVFTVSSCGARVSGTPTIQILSSPVQTPNASLKLQSGATSPVKPVVVTRVPISFLSSKVISSSSAESAAISSSPSKSNATVSLVTSITAPKSAVPSTKSISLKTSVSSKSTTSSQKLDTKMVISCHSSLPMITETSRSTMAISNVAASNENEFPSAFSKLISGPHALSKYTPPPIPPHFTDLVDSEDFKVEQCYECGDSFLFDSSLRHHYERRSIQVKVRCVQCNQMLVFYNKCKILRHAREHSDRGDVMQFSGAHISPIPLSSCKRRSKEFFLNAMNEKKKSKVTGCIMACTECSFVTDGQGTLEDHFQRRNADLQNCEICKLPLHNQCVYSAHMRMHRYAPPHTCPECGQTFEGNKMEFNLHLRMQCFHLSRASCYKCKLCNLTYLTEDQLRHHLRTNHVQIFYKCRECPMAFKTTQNIANHQRSAHSQTPEPTNTLKTIYKCPLCDTVFTDSSHSQQLFVLHKHFDGHINSTRITAYKCYLCSQLFEQKSLLRDHLEKDHDVSSLQEASAQVPAAEKTSQDMQSELQGHNEVDQSDDETKRSLPTSSDIKKRKHESTHSLIQVNKNVKRKRVKMQDTDPSDESLVSKKYARQPFKIRIKGMKNASNPDDASKLEIVAPLQPSARIPSVKFSQGKKTYPCPECDKTFLSSHSRSSHVRSIHRGIRPLYCCTHCPVGTVKFAKRVTLVKHLGKSHGIKQPEKDDIKIIRTQVPYISPGNKFDPSAVKVNNDGIVTVEKAIHEKKLPRKKITTARNPSQVRARRLATTTAAAAGKRMRLNIRGMRTSDESEESYGEVDEKLIEDGWKIEEEPEPKPENEDIGEIDLSLLRLPDVYTCRKCDFQHGDRLIFQGHIIEHSQALDAAALGNSAALSMVQCTECGLCFASTASLDKHMHIQHKIKNRALLERYDAKLRAERGDVNLSLGADANSVGRTNTIANLHRCKVCFRKFDQDSELKTHMRTHGLAFVKSKQH